MTVLERPSHLSLRTQNQTVRGAPAARISPPALLTGFVLLLSFPKNRCCSVRRFMGRNRVRTESAHFVGRNRRLAKTETENDLRQEKRRNGIQFKYQLSREQATRSYESFGANEARFSYLFRPSRLVDKFESPSPPSFAKTKARNNLLFRSHANLTDYSPVQPAYLSTLRGGSTFFPWARIRSGRVRQDARKAGDSAGQAGFWAGGLRAGKRESWLQHSEPRKESAESLATQDAIPRQPHVLRERELEPGRAAGAGPGEGMVAQQSRTLLRGRKRKSFQTAHLLLVTV